MTTMAKPFDKFHSDIATCCRLPLRFDDLDAEAIIARLPDEYANEHKPNALREKWHLLDQAGDPMPLLAEYPEIAAIFEAFPGNVIKAHISRMSTGQTLRLHRDGLRDSGEALPQFKIFNRTLRVHIVLTSNDRAWIYADGEFYHMGVGECWMLNNLKFHSAVNAHDRIDRYHIIFDVEPNAETFALLDRADNDLGFVDADLFGEHWPRAAMPRTTSPEPKLATGRI